MAGVLHMIYPGLPSLVSAAVGVLAPGPHTVWQVSQTGIHKTLTNPEAARFKKILVHGVGLVEEEKGRRALEFLARQGVKVIWLIPQHYDQHPLIDSQRAAPCAIARGEAGFSLADITTHLLAIPSSATLSQLRTPNSSEVAEQEHWARATLFGFFSLKQKDAFSRVVFILADQRQPDENDLSLLAWGRSGQERHLLGDSPAMQILRRQAQHLGQDALCRVMILGPTGTGKETVSRLMHTQSLRRDGPYVAVNCANFRADLMQSALFGHVKGAFTGADCAAEGFFHHAHGGTLFLDEVAELTPEAQSALLRVVQEGTFYRVGARKEERVDVRLFSATSQNMTQLIASGQFRMDLFQRLAQVTVRTPALSEHPQDIANLVAVILFRLAQERHVEYRPLPPAALKRLEQHPWPGNIRELENVLTRWFLLNELELEPISSVSSLALPQSPETTRPLEEIISDYLRAALAANGGNVSRTARALGISQNRLRRKLVT